MTQQGPGGKGKKLIQNTNPSQGMSSSQTQAGQQQQVHQQFQPHQSQAQVTAGTQSVQQVMYPQGTAAGAHQLSQPMTSASVAIQVLKWFL